MDLKLESDTEAAAETGRESSIAGWRGFVATMLAVFSGLLLACLALILAMNPYGNLPTGLFAQHVIMDINQRHQYPAIARSKTYDAAVLGTSTSRLLEPAALERAFGGRWANLAMNDARAWEQAQLGQLFLRHTPAPHALLVGLDSVWCAPDADSVRITRRGFPAWMYDEDPLNDWLYAFNTTTVDVAVRQAVQRVGIFPPRVPHDGYEVFVPPERDYDARKAADNVWRTYGGRSIVPAKRPYRLKAGESQSWAFPALEWLDRLLAGLPPASLRILAFVPIHVAAQPQPGSKAEAVLNECKRRTGTIAKARGAHLVDFMIASDITSRDDNYWDSLHYRVGVAGRIVDGLADAVKGRTPPAADGSRATWRALARPE